jgi:effector-binding domain-containing protein
MVYSVRLETVAEQLIAAARQRTTFRMVSKEIGPLLSGPWAFLRARPGFRPHGRNVAIYWDETGGGSIEVGVEVASRFEGAGDIVCSATPAGTVAATTHWGPYDQLGAAHEAVRAWCRENGREIAMPFWEVYGHWSDDPAKLRTDVIYRLK